MLQFRIIDILKPQTALQLNPVIFTGVFILIVLIWLVGYIGVHLVRKKPKSAREKQVVKPIALGKQTRMSALVHGIAHGIGFLNLRYFLVLPLVVLIGMFEFYLVFILSDFQYLDVLIAEYPFLFLFHVILIASSALLISWGLIRVGFFVTQRFDVSKLRRVRLLLLMMIDIATIWGTFTLFTIILDPIATGNVLLYLPIFITFWSVIWGLVYVRLRIKK